MTGRLTATSLNDEFGGVSLNLYKIYIHLLKQASTGPCYLASLSCFPYLGLDQFELGELPSYNELRNAIQNLRDPSVEVRLAALQVSHT